VIVAFFFEMYFLISCASGRSDVSKLDARAKSMRKGAAAGLPVQRNVVRQICMHASCKSSLLSFAFSVVT
jgi:hypothetical protein